MRPFEFERWTVYRLAREFYGLAHEMLPRRGHERPPLADQLARAAASIALNIAEGAGEFRPREKARFYRIALRSTLECAAALDLWSLHKVKHPDGGPETARRLLAEIAALLTTMAKNTAKRVQ